MDLLVSALLVGLGIYFVKNNKQNNKKGFVCSSGTKTFPYPNPCGGSGYVCGKPHPSSCGKGYILPTSDCCGNPEWQKPNPDPTIVYDGESILDTNNRWRKVYSSGVDKNGNKIYIEYPPYALIDWQKDANGNPIQLVDSHGYIIIV